MCWFQRCFVLKVLDTIYFTPKWKLLQSGEEWILMLLIEYKKHFNISLILTPRFPTYSLQLIWLNVVKYSKTWAAVDRRIMSGSWGRQWLPPCRATLRWTPKGSDSHTLMATDRSATVLLYSSDVLGGPYARLKCRRIVKRKPHLSVSAKLC